MVRIDGTSGLDARGPLDGDPTVNQAAKLPVAKQTQGDQNQEFKSVTSKYVQNALQSNDVNIQAVERASKLLASGSLDTPEAAQATADAIVDSGL
jgi:hypothetical protein